MPNTNKNDNPIMRERILELLGTEHGEVKKLGTFLNLSPNTISDWKAGRVKSYPKYAAQIAEYYNVSLDWLSGKTDIKKDAASTNTDDTEFEEYEAIYQQLSPERREDLMCLARSLLNRDHKQ